MTDGMLSVSQVVAYVFMLTIMAALALVIVVVAVAVITLVVALCMAPSLSFVNLAAEASSH